MNKHQKPMIDLIAELEKQLSARGQSPNSISQYHYIFQVFLAFFRSHHEVYFSGELMKLCLQEHYGIGGDLQALSRRQHYKKKVVRASRMIEDLAEGRGFIDRYNPTGTPSRFLQIPSKQRASVQFPVPTNYDDRDGTN